jgi:hypothetical protein
LRPWLPTGFGLQFMGCQGARCETNADASTQAPRLSKRPDVRFYAGWPEAAGLPGFTAQSVRQSDTLASIMGHGGESCTAVIKAYEVLTGVPDTLPAPARPP